MFDGFLGGFYRFGEVVMMLLYVNILWVIFTVLGLGFFGFGPSTVAMYTVFRRWSMGEIDVPVFTTFWDAYRKHFLKANLLGILILLIAYMLYVNLNFFELQNEWFSIIVRYTILIATFFFGIMLIYIFPLYVHYDNTFFNHFKNSILIAIFHPIRTAYAVAALFTLYYLFSVLPVLIFLMGPSLVSMVIMWISYRTFARVEYRNELLQDEETEE